MTLERRLIRSSRARDKRHAQEQFMNVCIAALVADHQIGLHVMRDDPSYVNYIFVTRASDRRRLRCKSRHVSRSIDVNRVEEIGHQHPPRPLGPLRRDCPSYRRDGCKCLY